MSGIQQACAGVVVAKKRQPEKLKVLLRRAQIRKRVRAIARQIERDPQLPLSPLAGPPAAFAQIAVLLDKPDRRVTEVAVDYIGFKIPDEFVVGYGLGAVPRLCDLKKVGGQYQGSCRVGVRVWWQHLQSGNRIVKHCWYDWKMEILNSTPFRIEGRSQLYEKGPEEWSWKNFRRCGKRIPLKWLEFVAIRPD